MNQETVLERPLTNESRHGAARPGRAREATSRKDDERILSKGDLVVDLSYVWQSSKSFMLFGRLEVTIHDDMLE